MNETDKTFACICSLDNQYFFFRFSQISIFNEIDIPILKNWNSVIAHTFMDLDFNIQDGIRIHPYLAIH